MTKETIIETGTLEDTMKLLIEKALDTTGNLVDFLSKETPEVLQLLMWHVVSSLIWALSFIGVIIIGFRSIKHCNDKIMTEETFSSQERVKILKFLSFCLAVVGMVGVIVNLSNCIKIFIAPKLYLLEYTADLVKY